MISVIPTPVISNFVGVDDPGNKIYSGPLVLKDTDLIITLTHPDETEENLTLNTHYSVTNIGTTFSNCQVTLTTAGEDVIRNNGSYGVGSGATVITLTTNIPISQLIQFNINSNFPASDNEFGLDKLTLLIAQINRTAQFLALRYPITEVTTDVDPINGTNNVLPSKTQRADKLLRFDENGEPVMTDFTFYTSSGGIFVLNEDDMNSNSEVYPPSQASVINYLQDQLDPAENPESVKRVVVDTTPGNIPRWGANDGELEDGYSFSDDDSMGSAGPEDVASSESTKAYIDTQLAALQTILQTQIDENEPTGIPKPFLGTTAPDRHLFFNGDTVGFNGSGSDHTDTSTTYPTFRLFEHMFNNFSDADAPLLTSAGAADLRGNYVDAAAAHAALTRMTLPDFAGYTPKGLDGVLTAIGAKDGSNIINIALAELPTIDVNISGGGGGANHRHPFTAVLNSTINAAASGTDDYESSPPASGNTGFTNTSGSSVSYNVINPGQGATGANKTVRTPAFGVNWMVRL